MLHTKFVKIGTVVLEKKMLMYKDGHQPIAISHPIDSGALKKYKYSVGYYKFVLAHLPLPPLPFTILYTHVFEKKLLISMA